MNADQLLDNYNELQKVQLLKNLNTFTLKELKKEIIKMKADKFAVTKMKRNQIIELIVQYHYLFPHLLTNQGTKRTAKSKQPTVKKQPNTQFLSFDNKFGFINFDLNNSIRRKINNNFCTIMIQIN